MWVLYETQDASLNYIWPYFVDIDRQHNIGFPY